MRGRNGRIIDVGCTVNVKRKGYAAGAPGTRGHVHFIGETAFGGAGKVWVGLVLDSPHGLNDGSKGGIAYFHCRPMHGLFVLPKKCDVEEDKGEEEEEQENDHDDEDDNIDRVARKQQAAGEGKDGHDYRNVDDGGGLGRQPHGTRDGSGTGNVGGSDLLQVDYGDDHSGLTDDPPPPPPAAGAAAAPPPIAAAPPPPRGSVPPPHSTAGRLDTSARA